MNYGKENVRKNKKTRPDITDYQKAIVNRDKKLLSLVNNGYNILHLSMGYDGILNKTVCDEGVSIANDIIDRCERLRGQ